MMGAAMVLLETTGRCPAGALAAVALEHLGRPYELTVVSEGGFLERDGRPGPRYFDGERTLWGRDAVAALLTDCLRAAGASHDVAAVAEAVRTRFQPAVLEWVRANDDEARSAASTRLRDALSAIEARLDDASEKSRASDGIAIVLTPVAMFLERSPGFATEVSALAEQARRATHLRAYERAKERIAHAATTAR